MVPVSRTRTAKAIKINANMPDYGVSKLREMLDRRLGIGLSRSRILIMGIAYKKNISDMRNAMQWRGLPMENVAKA